MKKTILAVGAALFTLQASLFAGEIKLSAFTFKVDEPWAVSEDLRPMTKAMADWTNPAGGDNLRLAFYHFGRGKGGTVKANIDRWKGQFEKGSVKEESVEELMVGETKVHVCDFQGTYYEGAAFGSKTPKSGFTMIGIIVESKKEGNVFLKVVGPAKDIAAAKESLLAMVKSIGEGE